MPAAYKDLTRFLVELDVESVPHSQKNYLAHLIAVYHFMKDAGCDEELSQAGMFHSIYGTQLFQGFKLELDRRDDIRRLVGDRAVIADTPWGKVGLTVCYDLRFAYLYRALAQAGASFLTVPSAFTVPTGRAHWETLLRARAIETGCFVFAPAQCGEHAEGRRTYGHSLIVSPWGEVLADAGEETGVIYADVDPAKVDEARRMIPALRHDRRFSGPDAPTVTPLRAAGE